MAIIFVDNSGGVFRTDLETGETRRLADYAQTWTDIAVTRGGDVYAITFGGLYELDLARGDATLLRTLSGTANGLAAGPDGRLYVGYGSSSEGIDVLGGPDLRLVDTIDMPVAARGSAGDMHVRGDTLWFASNSRQLIEIDLGTGQIENAPFHGIWGLYGLQFEAGTLYGLAGRTVYELDPLSGASEVRDTLPISGSVYGAATLAGVTVRGTGQGDTLVADRGGSRLEGLRGDDVLVGDDARDVLVGGAGRDHLIGKGGNDRLVGGAGRDGLDSGRGSDVLLGGSGHDVLDGGLGRDRLVGGSGHDVLDGGRGNDRLVGGGGRDMLEGGRGNDVLSGGGGRDAFVFEARMGRDVIRDFEDDRDVIELSSALVAGVRQPANLLSRYGEIVDGDAVLDFGGRGVLVIRDVDDLRDLRDDVFVF